MSGVMPHDTAMRGYESITRMWAKRRTEIRHLRAKGWTMQRIANLYGISRQRVWQIIRGNV